MADTSVRWNTLMSGDCSQYSPYRLLYVEDNPGDVVIFREALKGLSLPIELITIPRGEEALAYLHDRSQDSHPHLVLLDLNLPGMPGEQVLTAIKTDSRLKTLPVVIFTSAASSVLCKPVYREHANSCVRKANSLDSFLDNVRQLCTYWFSVASLAVPE